MSEINFILSFVNEAGYPQIISCSKDGKTTFERFYSGQDRVNKLTLTIVQDDQEVFKMESQPVASKAPLEETNKTTFNFTKEHMKGTMSKIENELNELLVDPKEKELKVLFSFEKDYRDTNVKAELATDDKEYYHLTVIESLSNSKHSKTSTYPFSERELEYVKGRLDRIFSKEVTAVGNSKHA